MPSSPLHEQIKDVTRRFRQRGDPPGRRGARPRRAVPRRDLRADGRARAVRHHRAGGIGRRRHGRARLRRRDGGAVARLCLGRRPVRPGRAGRHAAGRARHARSSSDATSAACCGPRSARPTASPRPRPAPTSRASRPPRSAPATAGGLSGVQALDPQRAGCRLRVRAGPHRQGRRQARHEHLHRRSRRCRRVARPQGAQDGAARIPGRGAALRRRASSPPTRFSARRTAASTS